MGGATTFIALFLQIYIIGLESILSRSCANSVTKYVSQNTQPRNNKQESDSFSLVISIFYYLTILVHICSLRWQGFLAIAR